MPPLETALAALGAHPGVDHVLVLGRDGLLIQHAGGAGLDAETVCAMAPGVAAAAAGWAAPPGWATCRRSPSSWRTAWRWSPSSRRDLLLAVLLRDGVGFAPLLRELAERRGELAGLV